MIKYHKMDLEKILAQTSQFKDTTWHDTMTGRSGGRRVPNREYYLIQNIIELRKEVNELKTRLDKNEIIFGATHY